ncbi:MAG: CoA transferase [Dehalococcoidia bacterium]|nr:CoA transferase [Dehalococcoidia bacterium]
MGQGALGDVVVLELGTGVAGPYCGKLLADLGAQVIKVEPPGGDPLRGDGPLHNGESAFFNWLNAGKLGVELDAADARVRALAAKADIIVHGLMGAQADQFETAAREANSHAVIISITPYGRSGERSHWKASPLTEYATSGYGYIAGDPSRAPLSLPGYQAEFHAGLHAATAALAGLSHARDTGEGQLVEISRQEAFLNDHSWLTTIWTHQGVVQQRTGSLYAKCLDGYIFLFNLVAYPDLFVLTERFDKLDDLELQLPLNWMARFAEVFEIFQAYAATRTKQEIYHATQELRIAVTPVSTMEDLANSTHLEARQYFGEVIAGGASFKAPGFPYKLTGTPCAVQGPAPALGQHNEQVFAPRFEWANAAVPHHRPVHAPETPQGPLAGLRVIEMTANWAGPIAGRHLADLGADVIKIELATKPATRALAWVANDLWPEHFNRSGYFNKLNRNKRTVCLNVADPAGRAAFLQLIETADVLIENNSARVMGQLGIGWDTLEQLNPRLVMCSMSGFGATGPERNYSAYGSNIETASGLASLLGYDNTQYFGTGTFYADPVTGNHGSVAILAALHARRTTGKGQWIDMALLEAVNPFIAQQFLEYSVTGAVPQPMGNRSAVYSPQDVYPTFGTDCWLALTVRDGEEWDGLCTVLGRDDWKQDDSLRSAEGRRARAAEIDEAIRTWLSVLDHVTAAEKLQEAGVPAAPVMPNWQLASDNHLHDRGYFVRIRHPEAGTFNFPGFPWRFSRTPASVRRPAPMFAEHNREVFAGVIGMSEDEIEALYAAGVTRDDPDYAELGSL